MCLHYGSLSVNVNYKSRQIVTFTMDKAISIVVRIACHSDAFADIVCYSELFFPEIPVYFTRNKRQDTDCNAANLEVSGCNVFF